MLLPDVNVLLAAFRPDHTHHEPCRRWIGAVVDGEARFGLSTLALAALVRISTNARIFPRPSAHSHAVGFCDDLLEQPHAVCVDPGERHWPIFKRLIEAAEVRGPLVTDAWYAALAIEWGCEWVTLDRDYARFAGLKWSLPE